MKAEISEASNNPSSLLVEAIHSVGYSGALANSLLASESAIGRLDSSILEEFVAVSWRNFALLSYITTIFVLIITKVSLFIMITVLKEFLAVSWMRFYIITLFFVSFSKTNV